MSREKNKQQMIYVTTSKDFSEVMTYWSKRLAISKSKLGDLCMRAGLGAVARALEPLECMEFPSAEVIGKLIDQETDQQVEVSHSEEGLRLEVVGGSPV